MGTLFQTPIQDGSKQTDKLMGKCQKQIPKTGEGGQLKSPKRPTLSHNFTCLHVQISTLTMLHEPTNLPVSS